MRRARAGGPAACLGGALAWWLAACHRGPSTEPAAEVGRAEVSRASASGEVPAGGAGADVTLSVDGRAFALHVPASASPERPAPLLVYLHHLGGDGDDGQQLFALRTLSDERGYLYAVPRSLRVEGIAAWNATDGCCERSQRTDDSSYLAHVIAEIGARHRVDPRRVFLLGHSNGGFMAYRLACDHADLIAAIASISGAMWLDATACRPAAAVSVLQVHGTADPVIKYEGGVFRGGAYPSAATAIADWAAFDRCAAPVVEGEPVPLSGRTATASTRAGCAAGAAVELWSVAGADHVPIEGKAATAAVLDWLFAHPRR